MAMSMGLMLYFLTLLMAMAGATQFKVGGSNGWSVPAPNAMSYNQWAEMNRFQIGDSLLFVYPPEKDSVLQVDKEAYDTCNTTTYIDKFDDGNTVFTFNRSGTFFFISGDEANCLKKETLHIVVLTDRTNRAAGSNQPSTPPPSSSPASSPSPPPPPPPPTEASSPPLQPPASSNPPSNSTEGAPAPPPEASSPSSPSPPPPPPSTNGASMRVVGFLGSAGAYFGSILLAL